MSQTAYKVHIKLGQAEFSAEGPEGTVKQQLADFLELAPRYAEQRNGAAGHLNGHANGKATGKAGEVIPPADDLSDDPNGEVMLSPTLAKRLFAENKDGMISLRVLPNGNSEDKVGDALFLLLFGHLALKSQSEVKASILLAAAKQSGVNLLRVDHSLDRYDHLVTRGGIRRGSRYALTNPGIEYARSVAEKMFG